MTQGLFEGPPVIQILSELPVVANQIVDRIVHSQADGDTGNKAGEHGKLDTEPPHDTEINDNWK